MKITLEQDDLNTAVLKHVTSLGVNLEGKVTSVDFTAGRGPNGNTATVDITSPEPLNESLPTPVEETVSDEETPVNDNQSVF